MRRQGVQVVAISSLFTAGALGVNLPCDDPAAGPVTGVV